MGNVTWISLTWVSAYQFSSVQFSCSVVSDSLRPHKSQHSRPPCPSPAPEVYSNSCSSSRRCHPGISSSVIPFSSCPQSLPASGSFPMSQLFASGGLSMGVSASISVSAYREMMMTATSHGGHFFPKWNYWWCGFDSDWC